MKPDSKLPAPDQQAQQHSQQLQNVIVDQIQAAGGLISFADFMQSCLYYPGLGYYSAGLSKIGEAGDFTTAPEISSLFSQALANHIADVLSVSGGDCLEFGAGSGQMAIDVLLKLADLNQLPDNYFIIEASADLRERQQYSLKEKLGDLYSRVVWLTHLPDTFHGAIIANEVCDAMPVHSFYADNSGLFERFVGWNGEAFMWQPVKSSDPFANQIAPQLPVKPYTFELNLFARAWVSSLSEKLISGAIFVIDYGYTESEYYAPQRAAGGIHCHFHHQVHHDPLALVGLQDITAHINFSDLANHAHQQDLHVSGFQTQMDFLVAGDILALASQQDLNEFEQLQSAAELKRLLLPEQMGSLFKVLTLTKNIPTLSRAQVGDLRWQL